MPTTTSARIVTRLDGGTGVVHLFVTERAVLAREAARLRGLLRGDARFGSRGRRRRRR